MRLQIKIAFLFSLLAISVQSAGVYPANEYQFTRIGLEDGLSDLTVYCIYTDHLGFKWFGTQNGLNCYDGYHIKTYKSIAKDPYSLNNSKIYSIIEDASKRLWVSSDKGVNIFDREKDVFVPFKNLNNFAVRTMFLDTDSTIWIGSDNGLYHYFPGSDLLKHYSYSPDIHSLPHNIIYSIYKDAKGNLFIGTMDGLCVYRPREDNFKRINYHAKGKSTATNDLILAIAGFKNSTDTLLVGSENSLVLLSYDSSFNNIQTSEILSGLPVKSLDYLRNGFLCVGTDEGLYMYNIETREISSIKHSTYNYYSLSNNVIWSVEEDSKGYIWIGTDNGVCVTSYNRDYEYFSISNITQSNIGNQLMVIHQDTKGNTWLGGTTGLIRYNQTKGEAVWYSSENGNLMHNKVRCLYEDEHNLWIGTDGGIHRYDYQANKIYPLRIADSFTPEINANWVYSIIEDSKHNLWIGTYAGGVFVVNKQDMLNNSSSVIQSRKHYYLNDSEKNSLSSNNIILLSFADKNKNSLWIATDNAGIMRMNIKNEEITYLYYNPTKNLLRSNFVKCMYVDEQGNCWIGSDRGLDYYCLSQDSIRPVLENELHNVTVLDIIESNSNELWLLTTQGTKRFDKKTSSVSTVQFGRDFYTCGSYDADNRQVFMGGSDAYIRFNPDRIQRQGEPSVVYLTGLYINNTFIETGKQYNKSVILERNLGETEKIVLAYNQNLIQLDFSNLAFLKKEHTGYAYKMEKLDNEWHYIPGSQNSIRYTNIPPGEYVFSIYSTDGTNEHHDRIVTSLAIIITPPWYKTWYAYLIYSFVIASVLWLLINYIRSRQRIKREKFERKKTIDLANQKIDFFTNVSHEFKTPLSLIVGPAGTLLGEIKNEKQHARLEVIYRNAIRLQRLINQLMTFNNNNNADRELNRSSVDIKSLTKRIYLLFEEQFRLKNIASHFNSFHEDVSILLDQTKYESILGNLLSNALKFTKAGGEINVTLSLVNNNSSVKLEVSDTGCGIPGKDIPFIFNRFYQARNENEQELNQCGTGIGLYLAYHYVQIHSGSIHVSSDEGKGSCFTVLLPEVTSASKTAGSQSKENSPDFEETAVIPAPEKKHLPLVLIVDDNIEIIDFICQNIEDQFNCITAGDGKEGFDKALKEKPDLIISDLMMPEMDGIAMSKKIRENIETASIPIILLTAKDGKETELEGFEAGVDEFIPKPFDVNYLAIRVSQLIAQRHKLNAKMRQKNLIEPKDEEIVSSDEKLLAEMVEIIEKEISNPDLNVDLLAKKLNISNKNLYRKIKSLTGQTIVDFIRGIRLKKAALLLEQGKFNVSEVMFMVGFQNRSYFTKCFMKMYGIAPKDYMSLRKDADAP